MSNIKTSQPKAWIEDLLDLVKKEKQNHFVSATHPKSLALGVHKGGSTMLHNFIKAYSILWNNQNNADEKINNLNIPHFMFSRLGITDMDFDEEKIIPDIMLSAEYRTCFSGWRQVPMSFLSHKHFLSQIPSVCLVRDPRDCAVSAYFSFLKTHRLPKDAESKAAKKILDERKSSLNMTIDDWVLDNTHRFSNEMSRVALFLHPNVRLYRYEDIWDHKEKFLQMVVNDLGFPFSKSVFQKAFDRINIKPGLDPRGHVRKGTPGDHREKLKESTRRDLFDQYQSVLSFFDYHY